MANPNDDHRSTDAGGVRRAQPEGTAQDPRNAETQRQIHEDAEAARHSQPGRGTAQDASNAASQARVHADAEAIRAEAARVEASTPTDVRNRTVGQIVDDANRRADR